MKRYSSIIKEDHETFKSQPLLWKSLDNDYRVALKHYLDSPILEIAEPTAELPKLDDPTSSSTIPSFEHNLTTVIEEDSAGSFTPTQEHISSPSATSSEEQPTLNYVFHQMTGSYVEPYSEKVETSSENEEIISVPHELLCSSHSSNGEGGSSEPHRNSSSIMGGPPDPHRDSYSSAGGSTSTMWK